MISRNLRGSRELLQLIDMRRVHLKWMPSLQWLNNKVLIYNKKIIFISLIDCTLGVFFLYLFPDFLTEALTFLTFPRHSNSPTFPGLFNWGTQIPWLFLYCLLMFNRSTQISWLFLIDCLTEVLKFPDFSWSVNRSTQIPLLFL